MKKKNICIVSECQQVPGFGGVETVSYILKEELLKNGYLVWSLYLIPKAAPTINDIQFPQMYNIYSNENKKKLIKTIEEQNIDYLMLQGTPREGLLELCIDAKKATGTKLIYTYHFNPMMCLREFDDFKEKALYECSPIIRPLYNLYLESKRSSFINKSFNKFKNYDIENIDAFVSVNKGHTDFFQKLYPQRFKSRFHTISNPIILEDNEDKTIEKENIILFVGRLTFQKRLDRLLHIWKDIQYKFKDWKVVVVGDGNYANEYKKITTDLKLQNIEFVGQQPSENYFKRSKIVCMMSSHEAFGMVLVEAQKYGCVPIAYNSFEAVTEIIQNEHNGVLIEPFKQKEYIKSLNILIRDDEYLKFLSSNGRAYIEKFNIKTIIQEWVQLLEGL